MNGYDTYVLVLCIIIFASLTAVFGVLITCVTRMTGKLISVGAEDEKIKTEYEREQNKANSPKILSVLDKVFSALLLILVIGFFIFSIFVNGNGNKPVKDIPAMQVVQSGSMSYVNEKNEYLKNKPHINNQIQTFDIIITHELPKEEDLKLYDVVVYEVNGILVVHRIVYIEEPNDKHGERFFLMQGDANEAADRFPVRYKQMKGIYRNERIPFVGSFISFMQSPAGYLCVLLVIFTVILLPIIEKWINKIKLARLKEIGFINELGVIIVTAQTQTSTEEQVEETPIGEPISETVEQLEEAPSVEPISETVEQVEETPIVEPENETVVTAIEEDEEDEEEIGDSLEENLIFSADVLQEIDHGEVTTATIFEKLNMSGVKKLTFRERYRVMPKETILKYNEIVKHLYKIKKLTVWEGKSNETYKKGRTCIAKLAFKGKTLNVYLNLNPAEYKDTKYVFTSVEGSKTYANYPMRVKVTSDRQVKWTKELITELCKKYGLETYAISKLTVIRGKNLSFEDKLNVASGEVLDRYSQIVTALNGVPNIVSKRSDKHETYRVGSKTIAKIKAFFKTRIMFAGLVFSAKNC